MAHLKPWVGRALALLETHLDVGGAEPNELDWKLELSPDKERLTEHLSAFANHADGGYLVFGIEDASRRAMSVDAAAGRRIINQLTNLGRDSIEPPIVIDHSNTIWRGATLVLVRIPEGSSKPVHRRGKSIDEAWIRSGGTTRKASRQEIRTMMLNSRAPRWEEFRATSRIPLESIAAMLDVGRVCHLLERPRPEGQAQELEWLAGVECPPFFGRPAGSDYA